MAGAGGQIASAGLDGNIRIWDGEGRALAVLRAHSGGIRALAMSAVGHMVASGGLDGTVKLWRPAVDAQATVLHGHTGLVRAVAVNIDGSIVASGGADGSVRVWLSQTAPPTVSFGCGTAPR